MYTRLVCNIDFVRTRTSVSTHKLPASICPSVVGMYTVSWHTYAAMGKFLLKNHPKTIASDSQDVFATSLGKVSYRCSDYTYSMSEV